MYNLFYRAIKHPLITGSSVIFVGSFVSNVFGYIFNLFMGRMLSAPDYGLLASLTSLLIMFSVLSSAFTRVFAKFSARYIAQDNLGKLKYLLNNGLKYILIIALVLLIGLLMSIGVVGEFLKVEDIALLILIFFSIVFTLVGSVSEGVMQGSMRFYRESFINIFQSVVKLVIAITLVYLGFQLYGAVISIFLSILMTVILGYSIVLKNILRPKIKSSKIASFRQEFSSYTYAFVLTSLGIALLSNTDIILVRYFFEPTVSGQYAALSLMGKAIFYLIMPINFVFFPLIAQKKERNERLFNTVLFTSGVVLAVSVALSFIYFAFPNLILKIFFPAPEYQMLRSYLGLFSLYILILSMVNIMNSFFLSIGKTKVYIFTLVGGLAQIGLIMLFHNSLYQIIGVLFIVNFLLLLSYFIYYMRHGKD